VSDLRGAKSPARPAAAPEKSSAPPVPTRMEAFRYWLTLGCISFGGPAGQIALMHRDLVAEKRWISERRFLHALNYCMVLPGPEAQQLATYIGWLMHRTWGGVVAGGLFVLPSLVVLIALSWIYVEFGQVPAILGVLYGIKPAVVAIVLHAAWRIGSRTLKHPLLWIIAAAAFVAIFFASVPFPAIVIAGALAGIVGNRFFPRAFAAGATEDADTNGVPHAPAVIDDATPTPPHARFTRARFAGLIVFFVALWIVADVALIAGTGREGTLAQMAWFFTKAALLTFGGAYAVLPYVYQGAVETFGWLTAPQMIDGLALGETTPGPLIMVVAFVGFVGAWSHAALPNPTAAGIAGACVATFFTFLPSFLFILAGGPLIESTLGNLRLSAPLTGVTAAVVGVIVSLAAFFALHVFWKAQAGTRWGGSIDATAIAIGIVAAIALFRYRMNVVAVIAICGAAGWIASQLTS